MPRKKQKLIPKKFLAFVLRQERQAGLLLLVAAALALGLANSPFAQQYFSLLDIRFTIGAIDLDIKHWINEGLMALFFLVVVLEVKREFIDGELRSWKKASFVVFAALGGLFMPALIFTMFNPTPPYSMGWAIPMSTDTAIALGVIGLIGRGIPKNLRVFLLALAIIDDVVCISVIGLFYSRPDNMFAFLLAILFAAALVVVRNRRWWLAGFTILGLAVWYCLLVAGVSGTLAGVIIGLAAPLVTSRSNAVRLQPAEVAEDVLLPVTTYLIVPIFVFVNAGLNFASVQLSGGAETMIFAGVLAGLVFGKPIGILGASFIATQLRLAKKPRGVTWTHILGIGFICGIGFTIALLVTNLSYRGENGLQQAAIVGVYSASLISGIIGVVILKIAARRRPKHVA